MRQVLIRGGRAVVGDLPVPACGPGEVLVRTAFSLISTGTETATVEISAPAPAGTIWTRRARKAGEVARLVQARGIAGARAAVAARLEGESLVTGYSLAGTVIEVGAEVVDLVPGQRVACAGASSAHHAEIVAVPRNLVVPVPEDLPLERAAAVTLGAIALHGVRQADLRLGEIALVSGLGLLGQLAVALLRASGCRVIGADVAAARVARAGALGLETGLIVGEDDVEERIAHATAGRGVDAVLVAASTPSSDPVRQAVRVVRRRGRIVIVGAVGLDIERAALYAKEAEIRIACSYGPGRYDPEYEQDGLDYPYAYVRWTENRNMEEFLRLAARGAVPVERLLDRVVPIDRAAEAYRALIEAPVADRPLAVLLRYEDEAPLESRRSVPVVPVGRRDGLGVALVGPGAFASEVHLPNLAALAPLATMRAIVARTGHAAREAARRCGAPLASTDLGEVLADPSIDAVIVCTRHDLHATQACRALDAGKAVFLEKPAALDLEDLARLEATVHASGRPFVVGFNRRFAPDVLALAAWLGQRSGPLVLTYRVNAGRLPDDHWTLGPQGGGRLVGEACHMLDLMRHLIGRPVVEHTLTPLAPPPGHRDLGGGANVAITCRHADGSLATLVYTTLGHPGAGKERVEISADGVTAVLDDFRELRVHGRAAPPASRRRPDKGHAELMRRFLLHASGQAPAPIPADEIFETSRLVLELARDARGTAPFGPGRPEIPW